LTITELIELKKRENCLLEIFHIEEYRFRLRQGEKKQELHRQAVELVLQKLGFQSPIAHRERGNPYLVHNPDVCVSISHSDAWVAVYIGQQIVGVDIQTPHSKICAGSSYFINEKEQQFKGNSSLLHLIWGAKETLYKLHCGSIDNLKEEATFVGFTNDQQLIMTYKNVYYRFYFIQTDAFTLVLT